MLDLIDEGLKVGGVLLVVLVSILVGVLVEEGRENRRTPQEEERTDEGRTE